MRATTEDDFGDFAAADSSETSTSSFQPDVTAKQQHSGASGTLTSPSTSANQSNGASEAHLCKGANVWYRQRDGSWTSARIVSVDESIRPFSYGVEVGGAYRETEAHRLRARAPGEAPPAPVLSPSVSEASEVYVLAAGPLADVPAASTERALPALAAATLTRVGKHGRSDSAPAGTRLDVGKGAAPHVHVLTYPLGATGSLGSTQAAPAQQRCATQDAKASGICENTLENRVDLTS